MAEPTRRKKWSEVKARLEVLDRKGLVSLLGDLYDVNEANRRFLYSRLAPGGRAIEEYRRLVADAIYPDPGEVRQANECRSPDWARQRATPSSVACSVRGIDGYTVSVYRVAMIQSFADSTTADLWEERNSKAARRVPRDIWPTVHRKLTTLDAAQRLDDLAALPGNRLEALVADRKGQHSIRVNQQCRITFRWEGHDAYDVCCEDYH